MKLILQAISWIALAATVLPPLLFLLFLTSDKELDRVKLAMLIAAVVWFIATPLWMGWTKSETAAND